MTTRRNNSARLAGGAALLGSLLCASFGHAEPLSTELRELRQKEIAQKSEAERARLMRNFKDFRALPVEEQERLRAFNRELKDDARNQGRLKAVMDEYYDWLATLTPGEQFDLRKEADPNRREKRVRDLLREQQEHVDATGARGAKSPKGLSSKDLAAVLGVIESAITKQQLLSAEETQRLHEKTGLAHNAYLLELAFRRNGAAPPLQFPWLSKEVVDEMVEKISNPKQVSFVEERPEERRWRLFSLIGWGMRAEYEKIKPDQDMLERFFVTLNSSEQDEIMRLPFDQQQQKLTHMFLTKKSEEDPNLYPKPPQYPMWGLRRPRGARPLAAPGDEQRAAEGDQNRKQGRGQKKNQKRGPKAEGQE